MKRLAIEWNTITRPMKIKINDRLFFQLRCAYLFIAIPRIAVKPEPFKIVGNMIKKSDRDRNQIDKKFADIRIEE